MSSEPRQMPVTSKKTGVLNVRGLCCNSEYINGDSKRCLKGYILKTFKNTTDVTLDCQHQSFRMKSSHGSTGNSAQFVESGELSNFRLSTFNDKCFNAMKRDRSAYPGETIFLFGG
mmetsp:Transcript_30207/g.46747  ORF Transcript_30207/g.46747 Transcript_30207/m.46747 type:complete len:116 (+) Transcript_30207:427-774(+)